MVRFSWGVMAKVLIAKDPQTHGMTFDEIRKTLLNAGMNKDSYLVEWSKNGVDRRLLEMIMGEDTPRKFHMANTLLEIGPPRILDYEIIILPSIHPSGLSPPSDAHQAGADSLMLIDAMRALIDLSHRDDVLVQGTVFDYSRTDEQILQTQEQLWKECGDDDDENDNVQSAVHEIDLLIFRLWRRRR